MHVHDGWLSFESWSLIICIVGCDRFFFGMFWSHNERHIYDSRGIKIRLVLSKRLENL